MDNAPTMPDGSGHEKARSFGSWRKWTITAIGVLYILFHIFVTAVYPLPGHQLRAAHLGFALVLVFLCYPLGREIVGRFAGLFDILLAVLGAASMAYIFLSYHALIFRAGQPTDTDILMGIAALILVIEITRRMTGWGLPILTTLALIYALLGKYFPAPFDHRGMSVSQLVYFQYLTMEGIFGVPLGASATFIVLFIVFASLLRESKGGEFYIDLANSLFGTLRGGPAKVSVVASGFFGSISGSAAANVVGTGSFTIPLMIKTGYKPAFAGAVEAVASTGGQIMPPVMGAVAFVMAEMLGVSYVDVVKAAFIPALLYFFSVYVAVDLAAVRLGLRAVPKEEKPILSAVLKKGSHLLIPLFCLLYTLLFMQLSAMLSALYGMGSIIVVAMLRKETRIGVRGIVNSFEQAAREILLVASATACAGIIIGVFSTTGLAMRFSSILVDLAQGHLPSLLFLTMVASIILGIGLPTTPAYVILAILVAPAIAKLGVAALTAHFFVMYFGCLSNITPPVAIAVFAASGLAKTNPISTGIAAVRIGLITFIIPYMFVYSPSLLLIGSGWLLPVNILTTIIGVYSLGSALWGYFWGNTTPLIVRIFLGAAAVTLIDPGIITDFIGLGLIFISVMVQRASKKSLTSKHTHA